MIEKVTIQKFKRYKEPTEFSFRPNGLTLLAGGNNSGKSTLLQALTLWGFARDYLEHEKGTGGSSRSPNVAGVTFDDFTPLAIPSFKHLWTDLKCGQDKDYNLQVHCNWVDSSDVQKDLGIAFTLRNDRLMMKWLTSSSRPGDPIPRVAYLPAFAGISHREEKVSLANQKRLIGRGLAGAVLRNILLGLWEKNQKLREENRTQSGRLPAVALSEIRTNDAWELLGQALEEVFKVGLTARRFDEAYDTTIQVLAWDGRLDKGTLKKKEGTVAKDLMSEGSGFLQWLSVYALAVDPSIDVLLLDEPDAHLHPALQGFLMDKLRKIAFDRGKQVLVATHSTTVLSEASLDSIFRVENRAYLGVEADRVGLFVGLGSEYAPRLDQLKKHKRLFMHDGPSDLEVLQAFASTLGMPWPTNLVCWKYTKDSDAREILFEELRSEITGLKCLSLQDRDDYPFPQTKADLTFGDRPLFKKGLGLRMWRRRNLENYLILPAAIARAAHSEAAPVSEADVIGLLSHHGLIIPGAFTATDCPQTLANTDGKEIITKNDSSITSAFGCTYLDIAEAMTPEEIPEDCKTMLRQLIDMCKP